LGGVGLKRALEPAIWRTGSQTWSDQTARRAAPRPLNTHMSAARAERDCKTSRRARQQLTSSGRAIAPRARTGQMQRRDSRPRATSWPPMLLRDGREGSGRAAGALRPRLVSCRGGEKTRPQGQTRERCGSRTAAHREAPRRSSAVAQSSGARYDVPTAAAAGLSMYSLNSRAIVGPCRE